MKNNQQNDDIIVQEMNRLALLCEIAILELESCEDKSLYDVKERRSVYESMLNYFKEITSIIDRVEVLCCGDSEIMKELLAMRQCFSVDELTYELSKLC